MLAKEIAMGLGSLLLCFRFETKSFKIEVLETIMGPCYRILIKTRIRGLGGGVNRNKTIIGFILYKV